MPEQREEPTLDKAIEVFVDNADGPFEFQAILGGLRRAVGREDSAVPGRVRKILREQQLTFHDGERDVFIPRRLYFLDAKFKVAPLKAEIQQGILLPGHRLMPFIRRDAFPAGCSFEDSEGRPLARRKVKWSVRDAIPFHSLFGWQNMLHYFVADDESNAVALAEAEQEEIAVINLTALDFSSLFDQWAFKEGDSLVLTVLDWDQGRFRVELSPQEKAGIDRAALEKQWCRALEDSLDEVFDESGVLLDAHEQLALAFFYGGKFLIEQPAIHLGGFLSKSRRLQLCQVGSQALLWRSGESPESWVFPDLDLARRPATGTIESLDAMLQDLGVSLRQSDLEAYMRDELLRGGSSLGSALQRCLRWRGDLNFHDDRQRFAFSRQIEDLWVRVVQHYSPEPDEPFGRHRSRALKIMDAKLEWLRKLDARGVCVEELPSAEFLTISQSMAALSSLLEALNAPDAHDLAEEGELLRTLDEIEESSRELMDSVEVRIEVTRIASKN